MEVQKEFKILVIDGSLAESALLMTLLSPLSRNIVVSTSYSQGLAVLQAAMETKAFFDLVFLALPSLPPPEAELAVKALALALAQNSDPHRTVVVGGDKLPPPFKEDLNTDSSVLCKPITREKMLAVLEPLRLALPRLNCWEYMKCGREPGGQHVEDLGACPVAEIQAAHGLHGGCNGGRACWAIGGTLCGGQVQGSFACKIRHCQDCDFYHLVQCEEGDSFASIDSILNRLRGSYC